MDIDKLKSLNKIDIKKDYNGSKIIHLIIINKKDKLLKEYLSKDYELNLLDKYGNTPYHLLLSQMYDTKKFIKLVNNKVCWDNENKMGESILDLILTNNTTFNELKSIQNKFMKKDILDNKTKNFENICQYLNEKNILKFQDIIKFDGNNPAYFYLTKNKNISNLAKFIQKLNNYKKLIKIRSKFGDNILGYYISQNKYNLHKIKDNIFQLIDIGIQPDYINPITGSQPLKYILMYSNDNKFKSKYLKFTDMKAIDNFGNNLGHFIISLYQKQNKKPDDIFYNIISKVDKKHKNISNVSISQIFGGKDITDKNIKIDLIKTNVDSVNTTQFRARLDDIIYHFYILEKKYKKLYIPKFQNNISHKDLDFDSNYISLPTELNLHLDDIPFFISYQNQDTYFIHPYLNLLISSQNKKNFACVFLSLQDDEGNLHANVLLYNYKNKTIQRFEPYGNTTILDGELDNILEEELTWNNEFTYLTPENIIKNSGLQSLSDDTNIIYQKPGDFGGFCLAWCIWFIEMVITNNIDYSELVNKSVKKILKDNSLIEYIRSYGDKITQEKYKIYKEIGLPKNIWSNIVFDNKYNNIIMNHLSQWLAIK